MKTTTRFSAAVMTLALASFLGSTFAANEADAPTDQHGKTHMKKKHHHKSGAQAGGAATAEKPGRESMKHETEGGTVKSEGAAGASTSGRDSTTHPPAEGGGVDSGNPTKVPGRSNMGR